MAPYPRFLLLFAFVICVLSAPLPNTQSSPPALDLALEVLHRRGPVGDVRVGWDQANMKKEQKKSMKKWNAALKAEKKKAAKAPYKPAIGYDVKGSRIDGAVVGWRQFQAEEQRKAHDSVWNKVGRKLGLKKD